MGKNYKFILGLFSFFILFISIVYTSNLYIGQGETNIGLSNTPTSSNFNFNPKTYSNISDEYINQNKRMYFDNGEGYFDSEVFGNFIPDGRIELYKSNSVNSNCSGESVSYFFSGNFVNSDDGNDNWGKGFRAGPESIDNYFCPNSGTFSITLVSRETEVFFDTLIISNNTEKVYESIIVEDSSGNPIELDERVIFSNAKLAIGGIVNKNVDLTNEFTGGSDAQVAGNNLVGINYSAISNVGTLGNLYSGIKRNISTLSRGLNWDSVTTQLSSITKQYTFINYENQSNFSPTNDYNQGKILTLNNSGGGIGISGEKNLVLKGGNIYINDNIYNEDKESILTIVALRDETNNQNGGNVYIHPDVTNIDAVIVAEGSILSYNGNVLNSITNAGLLRKQLLIYGSVVSRNTIGENISVFNTDDYIYNGGENNTPKYNLENLRSFQVVKSDQITGSCNESGKITALGNNNNNTAIPNAFAGRKSCYFTDETQGLLRPTHRTASTVIEYNPSLQLKTPSILKIN